jgi:hypothetical protein
VTRFVDYFCAGMAEAFTKVRAAALRAQEAGAHQSASLRALDPRQRRVLSLFRAKGSATAADLTKVLKLSPRTVLQLCREWIACGFLEYENAARKNRSYRLGARFLDLIR